MISRSTLLGALVVAELTIVGMAVSAVAGGSSAVPNAFSFGEPGRTALDRTFITGPAPHVLIDVADAAVTVTADPAPTTRVVEAVRRFGFVRDPEPLTVRQTADGIRVSAPASGDEIVFGGFGRSVRLTVPPNARIEMTSGAKLDASGLREKIVGHLASGAIDIRDHRGDVDVSTGSGAVRLVDVTGNEVAAATRDGRMYLTHVDASRINAHSARGRIVGEDLHATDGVLTTRDGRILLSFTGNSDATARAHTADGIVKIAGFPVLEEHHDSALFRMGTGRGTLDLSTENGDIKITQGASS